MASAPILGGTSEGTVALRASLEKSGQLVHCAATDELVTFAFCRRHVSIPSTAPRDAPEKPQRSVVVVAIGTRDAPIEIEIPDDGPLDTTLSRLCIYAGEQCWMYTSRDDVVVYGFTERVTASTS